MTGAVAGDIIGSVYEQNPIKTKDFPLFNEYCTYTDDSVLTVAIAHAILNGRPYKESVLRFARRYPGAGYGGSFIQWFRMSDPKPYNSWGNGSAMRVSPVGFLFEDQESVLLEAKRSAEISHNHPEGIKGAMATALAVYMARKGSSKDEIRNEITSRFTYNLNQTIEQIRPEYGFDVSCQGSVPEAIIAFLESDSWEDAIRNAISLGGDSDTLACIAGGISEAYYGRIPETVSKIIMKKLPADMRVVIMDFTRKIYPDSE